MSYYFTKILEISFEDAVSKVTEGLKKEGFGVLTRIDIKEKFKEKLNVEFKKYLILGACNPPSAYDALKVEDKIGLMLPCNIIVQEIGEGKIEMAAIDPMVSMQVVKNSGLGRIAEQVGNKLKTVIQNL